MKFAILFLRERMRLRVRWLGMTLFCLSCLLPGCAGTSERPDAVQPGGPEGSFGPGYPPGSAVWSEGAKAAYRSAFLAGMQDQKEGYRFDDDRGAMPLEVGERGFYRQGYRRGYYHEANVRRQEQKELQPEAAVP